MPSATTTGAPRRFLTRKQQAERYQRDIKTIKRWGKNPKLKMPPEYVFNDPDEPMRREDELEVWERSRVAITTAA